MSEEVTTEVTPEQLQERERHLLLLHGDIFAQLMRHDRFKVFLAANYDIHVNEETQRFEVKEFAPSDVMENMKALQEEINANKVKQPEIIMSSK